MDIKGIVAIVIIALTIIGTLILLFVLTLGKAAAPSTPRDRIIDDFMQAKAVNSDSTLSDELLREYIRKDTNRTITSGCPVENNK